MATYFKYAQRNAEDYIDWGAIGKTMSDTLLKEQLNRDMMKSEIDKASREFGEVLSNAPQGEHRGLNEYSQEFASNAQQYQLMQLRNLKAGKLSLKDYLIGRENLKQGANDAFDIIKKYNDKYGEYQQRVEDGVASNYQTFLLGEVEGFGNLTNTSLYINPTNGKVSAGKRVLRDPSKPYDPVNNPYTAQMSDDPNDFRSLVDLNFALSAQIDKYDANAAIDDIANKYDNTYEVLTKGKRGEYTVIDDITQMGEDGKTFKESLEQDLKARFLTNPIHTISSLVDWLQEGPDGEPIEFTRNPAEANAHTILLKPNPEQPEGGTDVMDMDAEGAQELIDHLIKTTTNSVITQLNKKVRYQRGFAPQTTQTKTKNVKDVEMKNFYLSEKNKIYSAEGGAIDKGSLFRFASLFGVPVSKEKILIDENKGTTEEVYRVGSIEDVALDSSPEQLLQIIEAQIDSSDMKTAYTKKGRPSGKGSMAEF
jgi:hypothetical protein